MKKLLLFAALFAILAAYSPNEQRVKANDVTQTPERRLNPQTGVPAAIYQPNFRATAASPEQMARQYLQTQSTLLQLQQADLSDLSLQTIQTLPTGHTVHFQQLSGNLPLYGGKIAVHINHNNDITFVSNSYIPTSPPASFAPAIAANEAVTAVANQLNLSTPYRFEQTTLIIYPKSAEGKSSLAYLVQLAAQSPIGDWEAVVDALTGEIHSLIDRSATEKPLNNPVPNEDPGIFVEGTGNIFDPDPLSSLQAYYGGSYTDNNDLNAPWLDAQLTTVSLQQITRQTNGQYLLKSPYADIVDYEAPFNGLHAQNNLDFRYNRSDDEFEAVNTFYHIDESMRYVHETLGVIVWPTIYYNGGARFDPAGLNGADNSRYSPFSGYVTFGEGGVDDAEDAEVVRHELAHGLHDWITGGNFSNNEGLSEGFADYWAQSYSRSLGQWGSSAPGYHYVFNWDGHNEFWTGRTTNYDILPGQPDYPGGLIYSGIHKQGQILSTCLMQIWDQIGREETDKAILVGLGLTGANANQNDAAAGMQQAAIDMQYPLNQLQIIHNTLSSCGYTIPTIPYDFSLTATPDSFSGCSNADVTFNLAVNPVGSYTTAVNLTASNAPEPATIMPNNQIPPFNALFYLENPAPGNYTIPIYGNGITQTHSTTVTLTINSAPPAVPNRIIPSDGSFQSGTTITFIWGAIPEADAYIIEIDDDPTFISPDFSTKTAGTQKTMSGFAYGTTYYWRVRGENECGMSSHLELESSQFEITDTPRFCSTQNVILRDLGSSQSTLTIPATGPIKSMTVSTAIDHTWVGDLSIFLTRDPSNTTAVLLDRPGYTDRGKGCKNDHIDTLFDDTAPTAAEDQCQRSTPTIGSRQRPFTPLSTFIGLDINGSWTLQIDDAVKNNSGTLHSWCLEPVIATPVLAPPEIIISPLILDATIGIAESRLIPIDISNLGNEAGLYWQIEESQSIGGAAASANCNSSGSVSWLCAQTTENILTPLQSETANIIVDSTNMLPGSYTAYLHISSNDPLQPLSWVTVNITVTNSCAALDPVSNLTSNANGNDLQLSWPPLSAATDGYEIWSGAMQQYDAAGWDCAAPPAGFSCTATAVESISHTFINALTIPDTAAFYTVYGRNSCGSKSTAPSNVRATFSFGIVPGN